MYRLYLKRIADMAGAALLLLLLFPLMLGIACLLWLSGHRPVYFVQQRIGHKEQPFFLFKFRSMTRQTDAKGQLLPDALRLTPLGIFLRRYSLDELPQLFNVLAGQMSLIGPRPLLPEYLPLYNDTQRCRHAVRPGITGLAQVKGRNAMPWKERLFWDVYYAKHLSFQLDLHIFLLTIRRLFTDSSLHGDIVSSPFTGN
jgi:undecaprenyl phosphate N,N'-diacetylbacillosamine 1-phosphate transferase